MTNTQANDHTDLAVPTTTTHIKQLQIVVRWGQNVLAVRHLSPLRSFFVGESSAEGRCDHVVPAALLAGATRHELIVVDPAGQVEIALPRGGRASVTVGDEPSIELGEAQNESRRIGLLHGHQLCVELGELRFDISSIAEPKLRGASRRNKRPAAATMLSALMHIGILAATAAFVPQMSTTDDMMPTDQQRYTMQQYLDSSAAREREASEQETQAQATDTSTAPDAEAEASEQTSSPAVAARTRLGDRGGRNPGGPGGGSYPVSAAEAIAEAGDFGIIPMLRADPNGNVPSWLPPADDSGLPGSGMYGNDLFSPPGDLTLSGPGNGSGQPTDWYTLPSLIQTPFPAFAPRKPLLTNTRVSNGPNLRMREPVDVSKGIPAAVIQRIIRANFGRFRDCYNAGLRTNPSLAGRVAVRFLIGRTGTVSSAADGGSSMPDKGVVSCVVGAFRGLTFPAPESGVVTVSYPIMFMPPAST